MRRKGVQVLAIVSVAVIGMLILLEVGLRLVLGLGNSLIYIPDSEIGYLLAPNQQVHRLGNRILINEYSMRSDAIEKQRPASTLRILLLGDSIANGAWWTDQTQTISALMTAQLQSSLTHVNRIEVLNASANSWGPRNQEAYLRRYGLFESQIVVLLLNTDDLFAIAPTSLPVGRDRNYPDHRPPLALIEGFNRFLTRPQPIQGMVEVRKEKGDRVGLNLEAITKIQSITKQANAQLLLAMSPLLREVETNPRDYELRARQRLQLFSEAQQIPYLDFLPLFKQFKQPDVLYRDHIHLTPQGNQLVSETLNQKIFEFGLVINKGTGNRKG